MFQLLENDIYISTSDEISLIREAQRSLERNNNIQADSLHDIAQSLDKMKEENQDRFESIDKAQVSLRKAINDINNKSIDQQKLASDLQQVKIDLESMNNEAKLDRKSITDRIGITENTLKEVDSLLQQMVCLKHRRSKRHSFSTREVSIFQFNVDFYEQYLQYIYKPKMQIL
jgi:chromosome segregation ATPase